MNSLTKLFDIDFLASLIKFNKIFLFFNNFFGKSYFMFYKFIFKYFWMKYQILSKFMGDPSNNSLILYK